MESTAKFWDKKAEKYSQSPIKNMDAYDQTIARVKSYLSPNDTALEFGCGTGTTGLRLANSVGHLTATDYSANMVEIGREKASKEEVDNLEFKVATLDDPSFEKGSMDVVMGFNVLHLIRDVPTTAGQAHELLKPDGLFITKSTCLSGNFMFAALRPIFILARMFGLVPFVNYFSIKKLEDMITNAGFEIIERGDYPKMPPNHFVVARKIAS